MTDRSDGANTIRWGDGHVPHARLPEWVLDAEISDRAVRLYARLARYADYNGQSFPSKARLAEQLRCARSTLDEAMKELQQAGALIVFENFDGAGGRQTTNNYVLSWSPPSDRSAPSDLPEGTPSDPSDPPPSDGSGTKERVPEGTSAKRDDFDSSLRSEIDSGLPEPVPPPIPKIDGQNRPLNTLLEVCHIDPENRQRVREAAVALNGSTGKNDGITHYAWIEFQRWLLRQSALVQGLRPTDGESWSHALERAIRLKARLYGEALPGAVLTPGALRKWWLDLEAVAGERTGEITGDDLRRG